MPAPPKGVCHFPVMKDGRQVFCGVPTAVIDPNTGELMLWCAEHALKLEALQKKIRQGELQHREGKLVIGKVQMY